MGPGKLSDLRSTCAEPWNGLPGREGVRGGEQYVSLQCGMAVLSEAGPGSGERGGGGSPPWSVWQSLAALVPFLWYQC